MEELSQHQLPGASRRASPSLPPSPAFFFPSWACDDAHDCCVGRWVEMKKERGMKKLAEGASNERDNGDEGLEGTCAVPGNLLFFL